MGWQYISERFAIKRGCRQGDPISGYLFILCIEILALALRNSKAKPYQTHKGNEHLQEQYADDMTIFLDYVDVDDDLPECIEYQEHIECPS